jgi:hypothetical protein
MPWWDDPGDDPSPWARPRWIYPPGSASWHHDGVRYLDEMMSRRLVVLLRLLSLSMPGLVACGDPGVDPDDPLEVEFEPLCGRDGPVELLAVEADEEVMSAYRIGDGDEIHVRTRTAGPVRPDVPVEVRRSVVLDECGGMISEVASPAHALRWLDDALVGCIDGDLVLLTDYDDPSPSILAQGCDLRQVGDRLVAVHVEVPGLSGPIMSISAEGSAVTMRELVDSSAYVEAMVSPGDDGKIVIQTPELAVYRVDPDTGERELLLDQAAEGRWSFNGDTTSYQLPPADPEAPGPVILRNQRTGAEQTLDPGFPVLSFGWYGDGLLGISGAQPHAQQWYLLDPLRALA